MIRIFRRRKVNFHFGAVNQFFESKLLNKPDLYCNVIQCFCIQDLLMLFPRKMKFMSKLSTFLVQGQIRTVIGQAQLLIAQRFKQFSGLVDDCEFNRGEKETTCTDLQGFWDMIYFQVHAVSLIFIILMY